jgi:fatty-acyl-CoA synthase
MTSSRISEHFPARRAFGRPARPAWPLMSYSRGRGTVPLRDDTVGQALRRTVERFGDQDALLVPHQGYRATFSEFWAQVGQAARALLALEVRKGDRIGIWSPNRYEWVVTQFATARVGAILVTIDPDSQATELQYALSKAGVSWLLMARGYRDTDYVATLARVRADCPQLRAPISLDDDWAEFMAAGAHVTDARLAEREATLDTNDPITIQFTPGGTGTPKGATLSHHSIVNTPHQVANTVGNTGGCRADGTIPLHHHFAPVLGTLARVMQGAAIAWPSEPFDQAVHRSVPVVRALPHMEIKIVDPRTGTTVPRGTAGE